jgi:hypothetical protein
LADADKIVAESIRGRLHEELARRDVLAAQLAGLETRAPLDADKIVADITARTRDLEGLLRRHQGQARQVIRLLLGGGRWQAAPFNGPEGRGYHFKAKGDYRNLGVKSLAAFTISTVGNIEGEIEFRRKAERHRNGIPLSDVVWNELKALAVETGVPFALR